MYMNVHNAGKIYYFIGKRMVSITCSLLLSGVVCLLVSGNFCWFVSTSLSLSGELEESKWHDYWYYNWNYIESSEMTANILNCINILNLFVYWDAGKTSTSFVKRKTF